ncbi:MAG: uracil-DNA glycosylase [Phycisphaerales bacterium]|nr:MAG: uracil-DNA glycosylase [Phycisphaerales bacterium]
MSKRSAASTLKVLQKQIPECTRCPELRAYLDEVGRTKRRAYADWTYWARPVPGFGDFNAGIMIVGLAPAAHGANRTGRMFTGDRSGDFLYAGLYRAGLANQPEAVARDDGMKLSDVYITASLRCAPPANKPTATQLQRCRPYLLEEIVALQPRVLLCLGGIGWNAALTAMRELKWPVPSPKPKFGHGAECPIDPITLLGCYHVSQQNTFTGRLTETMLDQVLERAKSLAGG